MELLPNDGYLPRIWGLNVEEEHGGGCCGIVHLHRFPDIGNRATDEQRQGWIKKALENAVECYAHNWEDEYCDACDGDCCDRDSDECDCPHTCGGGEEKKASWHCAVEVVLANYQVPEWKHNLEACGFKEVFSFHNSNSGNQCHVFYCQTNA